MRCSRVPIYWINYNILTGLTYKRKVCNDIFTMNIYLFFRKNFKDVSDI